MPLPAPLETIAYGGREWKIGRLTADDMVALLPAMKIVAAWQGHIFDIAVLAAVAGVAAALLREHHPEMATVEAVAEILTWRHIDPVMGELNRQVQLMKLTADPSSGSA